MPTVKVNRLGELNAYQIAGLAIVVSTATALSVLYAMRHLTSERTPHGDGETSTLPKARGEGISRVPHHFSENLTVPGFTETGREVSERDARQGRSPEGA